jgi:hypothetical protein
MSECICQHHAWNPWCPEHPPTNVKLVWRGSVGRTLTPSSEQPSVVPGLNADATVDMSSTAASHTATQCGESTACQEDRSSSEQTASSAPEPTIATSCQWCGAWLKAHTQWNPDKREWECDKCYRRVPPPEAP